jgi:hypothetical protein
MLGLARLAALGIACALAGCVTTAENSLSQNDIAAMKLTGVTVSFAPDAGVQWEDGIRAYATAKAITDDQIATAANTPEGKAYVQAMLASVIRTGVTKSLTGQLVGSRPVRLDVVVKSFAVASAVQRILIGGGRGMVADANLVDARTGAVIIAYPGMLAANLCRAGDCGNRGSGGDRQRVRAKRRRKTGFSLRRDLPQLAAAPKLAVPPIADRTRQYICRRKRRRQCRAAIVNVVASAIRAGRDRRRSFGVADFGWPRLLSGAPTLSRMRLQRGPRLPGPGQALRRLQGTRRGLRQPAEPLRIRKCAGYRRKPRMRARAAPLCKKVAGLG